MKPAIIELHFNYLAIFRHAAKKSELACGDISTMAS